jgi:hypothetical protein
MELYLTGNTKIKKEFPGQNLTGWLRLGHDVAERTDWIKFARLQSFEGFGMSEQLFCGVCL